MLARLLQPIVSKKTNTRMSVCLEGTIVRNNILFILLLDTATVTLFLLFLFENVLFDSDESLLPPLFLMISTSSVKKLHI